MEKTTCGRCQGEGVIPRFAHVANGICFRCWGSGEDPEELFELRKWLDSARREYRKLRSSLKAAKGRKAVALEALLRDLATLGKANAAKLAELEVSYEADRTFARALGRQPSL